ncbi:MAG: S8/S53 family peptidase [Bacteroidota bacterium]
MKGILILLFLIFSLIIPAQRDNNLILPYSKQSLDKKVHSSLELNQEVFQWDEETDEFIWSVLVNSDSMVSIGYRPLVEERIRARIHTLDLEDQNWKEIRAHIIDTIWTHIQSQYVNRYSYDYLFPYGINSKIPVINVKIFDLELVKFLRRLPQVRYFHPMDYTLDENVNLEKRLSDSGCGSLNGNILNGDYSPISPQSRASWHHQEANIDLAWNDSNKGDAIWVAVIDTGVSADQDKLNGEFAEGESSNRTIEKKGFYKENETDPNYDGWQDQCGHGTQMAGLIAAPRGFDDTPAGIAYKSNLVSYRATRDVVINRSTEKMGVSEALTDAADDSRIKIISMSIGDVFYNGQVADAIVYAHNKGKLIFAAAGTSTYFTSIVGTIFPASMDETIAVTGVQNQSDLDDRKKCDTCHKGSSVDFVAVMQRSTDKDRDAITLDRPNNSQGYVGGSSAATATTAGIAALVWGNNPTWTSGQVLNKLIQSADYYPNRDGAFGWGKIDAQEAVNNLLMAGCTTTLSNEVTIEITNISFPAEDDNGDENEWVITLEGESYYFDVDEDGASGSPANYINLSVCGSIPMFVDLGASECNENSLNLAISSHEDDSTFSNCTLNSFDDHYSSETLAISLGGNTFTHTSSAGDFVFTYIVYCSPTVTPASSIVGDTLICQ